jgi:hypothetical protein
MLQLFAFSGPRIINAQATFFKLETSVAVGADEAVRVRADGQDLGTYLPGDSITLPTPSVMWEITPVTATAVGSVRLGMGEVGSARIAGSVRVIDQGADKTLLGAQYLNSSTVLADAAAMSLAGLRPVNRTIALKRIAVQSDTAGNVFIARGQSGTAVISSQKARNKDFSGAASDGDIISAKTATTSPTPTEIPGWDRWVRVYAPANTAIEVPMTTPIIMKPGAVLYVSGETLNRQVSAIFDFEEL